MDPKVLLPVIGGIALGYVILPAAAGAALKSRYPRCLTCPETGESELVRIGMARAVLSFFTDGPQRVIDCTRWPANGGCLRGCLSQLD